MSDRNRTGSRVTEAEMRRGHLPTLAGAVLLLSLGAVAFTQGPALGLQGEERTDLQAPVLSAAMLGEPRPGEPLNVAVSWSGPLPQTINAWIDLDGDGEMTLDEIILEGAEITEQKATLAIQIPVESPPDVELRLFTAGFDAAAKVRAPKGIGTCNVANEFYVAGFPEHVMAMEVFDDGGGAGLYVAGNVLSAVGNQVAGQVNRWDGSSWTTLSNQGLSSGTIRALAVFDDGSGSALYAGNYALKRWNGSSWVVATPTLNSWVNTMAVFDDGSGAALFVGGNFTTAGGSLTVNYIAKWDGSSWSALGTGMDDAVRSLYVWDDGSGAALYAAGEFTTAGGTTVNGIAKWNGSTWSALGTGINNYASALVEYDDGSGAALYVAGRFTLAGGISVFNIAKWNGSSWSHPGFSMANETYSMVVFDDGGGQALHLCGVYSGGLRKWDGTTLSTPGGGVDSSYAWSLATYDAGSGPELYLGGTFNYAGGTWAANIAKWDGTSWSALAGGAYGMNDGVHCFTTHDDGSGMALYAGGEFSYAGATATSRVARWNGAGWSPVGTGVNNGLVKSFAVHDDGSGKALYAGGSFTSGRVARWDGSTWSIVGGGMNSTVNALAVFDDGSGPALYAAGQFTTAGGTAANRIAKWDGASWSALGSGLNNTVNALVAFDDGSGSALYVGGTFTTAGGATANRIAKWDGVSWSTVGGMTSWVNTLAVFDDGSGPGLFAAGNFSNRIAKWAGVIWGWVSLGSGLNGEAHALVVHDDGSGPALYVGGVFTTAGGISAPRVARWDGTWSGLLSDANSFVRALGVFESGSGPELWIGGEFTIINSTVATRVTRWSCTCDSNHNLNAGEWALIGLSCSPSFATVQDVLGDDLDIGDYGSRWAVVARDEQADAYQQLIPTDTLEQGEGYWIKSLDAATIDTGGAPASTLCPDTSEYNQCFDIPLEGSSGRTANLVSHPFSSSVPWADVRFVDASTTEYTPAAAEAAGIAEKTMYLWNGSAYEPYDGETPGMEGDLSEFTGLWVYANEDLTLRIPTASELASSKIAGVTLTPEKAEANLKKPLLPGEWYVRVIASADAEGMSDPANVLGQLTDSFEGKDRHDLEELAPFGARYLTVVFPHPEWPGGGNYASDYHSVQTGLPDSWYFEVHSDDPQREVTLSFTGPAEILDLFSLTDELAATVIHVGTHPTYAFTMGATVHPFSLQRTIPFSAIFSDGFESGDVSAWSASAGH